MSSAGYADRLKPYDNKGVCGLPESCDSRRVLDKKIGTLVDLVRGSKHTVILTGAGVSTSAGIPDFRGPNGVWTRQMKEEEEEKAKAVKEKEKAVKGAAHRPAKRTKKDAKRRGAAGAEEGAGEGGGERENSTEGAGPAPAAGPIARRFEDARPTLTHRAITHLTSLGYVSYVATQNVDGMHRRSGLHRGRHSALHGCVFTEKCEDCGMEYFRDFDLGGVSFKKTGRKCERAGGGCGGDLRDTILDWDDALPVRDWEWAQDEFSAADLCLALGTSLRIEPVGCLPLQAKRFVIVNLQATPFDKDATLIIRSRVDEVMDRLLYELHIYDQVGDDWAKPTYPVGTKVTKEFDGVCELVRHCLFL